MGKKIIVAGGGHGGIAAAAILAENGYDVTVFEKNKREEMGYDWTDIFDRKGLFVCGMDMPDEDKYLLKNDMTFINPSRTVTVKQHVPQDQLEIQMERRDIYDHIIAHAEECGVKFRYETAVEAPVILGSRVAGVKTADGVEYADLVIDAAGMDSPVRRGLPEYFGIQNEPINYECFYVYRGFFNKTAEVEGDKFRVNLFFDDEKQICWVADDGTHTDVLIGRFEPFGTDVVEDVLVKLREVNPDLGTQLIRGGQFVKIPVRQPLGVLVADGYAAIGDSAFMTVPIIGSGIANSLKAARILADAVMSDKKELYNAQTLWKYQRGFYKKLGNGLAPLAVIKLMMKEFTPRELDYLFEQEILNSDDMTIGADSNSLMSFIKDMLTFDGMMKKFKGVFRNPAVCVKVTKMSTKIAAVVAATNAMPVKYDRTLVNAWVKTYNACFK